MAEPGLKPSSSSPGIMLFLSHLLKEGNFIKLLKEDGHGSAELAKNGGSFIRTKVEISQSQKTGNKIGLIRIEEFIGW